MLSKKAAGLIGLGATVAGTTGGQLVSADLTDLIKDKNNKNRYIWEINQIRDWAAVSNVANKINDLISGKDDPEVIIVGNDNTVVNAIRETIANVSVNNVKTKLEKFKNDAKGLKNYCNSTTYKTVYDAAAAKVLKRLTAEYEYNLNPEVIEKIWVNYSNNVSSKVFKKNTIEEQIEIAKQEGVAPEQLVSGLLEKVNVQVYDTKGKLKDVRFKDSNLYKRLFDFNVENELRYLMDYDIKMEDVKNGYNGDGTRWNIDEGELAWRSENGPVKNYYEVSDRGRIIFLNKLGYYEKSSEKLAAKAEETIKDFAKGKLANLVGSYLIPGGKLASIAAEPFTKYFVAKSEQFVKNKLKEINGEEFFSNKDNNIPEEEKEFFTKENAAKTVDKMFIQATGIKGIEEKVGKSLFGTFSWSLLKMGIGNPFEGFNKKITGYLRGTPKK